MTLDFPAITSPPSPSAPPPPLEELPSSGGWVRGERGGKGGETKEIPNSHQRKLCLDPLFANTAHTHNCTHRSMNGWSRICAFESIARSTHSWAPVGSVASDSESSASSASAFDATATAELPLCFLLLCFVLPLFPFPLVLEVG
jgi:hypothetical protein